MDEHYTMIYKNDLSNPVIMELLDTIKEKNSEFHTQLCLAIEKRESAVCREDVLRYFAESAENLFADTFYIYHISSLMENVTLSPSWFQWFNDYFSNGGGTGVDDFMVVISEAVEKNIPLEETRKIFEQGGDDILLIYDTIDQYHPEISKIEPEKMHEELQERPDEMNTDLKESPHRNEVNEVSSNVNMPVNESGIDNFTGMFESLVKAMSIKGRSMDIEVLDVQDNLNKIIAKFQLVITELSAYSTEIIREWEKDKEENERMMALHNLQQTAIENQQRKINELRNENLRLTSRIQDASKSEIRRAAINKKITELQSLTSNQNDAISAYDWPDDLN